MGINNVSSVGYNELENKLIVQYSGGSVCEYTPVNPESYAAVLQADCLQRAVHNFIRHSGVVGTVQRRGH
jgi:hypothetical protein